MNRLPQPIVRRIRLLVGRGVVRLVNDALKIQGVQLSILDGETWDNVERFQQYGFTANPQPGVEAIVLSLGGRRNHSVVISVDDRRYRLKNLAPGEVAMYTDEGDTIIFKRGRNIEVTAGTKVKVTAPDVEVIASTKVQLTSPLVECSAQFKANGLITGLGGMAISGGSGATVQGNLTVSGGNVTADGIGLKTHVHGGVQTGAGNTGLPSG